MSAPWAFSFVSLHSFKLTHVFLLHSMRQGTPVRRTTVYCFFFTLGVEKTRAKLTLIPGSITIDCSKAIVLVRLYGCLYFYFTFYLFLFIYFYLFIYLFIFVLFDVFSVVEFVLFFSFFLFVFGLQIATEPLHCFPSVVLITWFSLWCFTDEVEDPYVNHVYVIWSGFRTKGEVAARVKLG